MTVKILEEVVRWIKDDQVREALRKETGSFENVLVDDLAFDLSSRDWGVQFHNPH
jgi:hypothetical protein